MIITVAPPSRELSNHSTVIIVHHEADPDLENPHAGIVYIETNLLHHLHFDSSVITDGEEKVKQFPSKGIPRIFPVIA